MHRTDVCIDASNFQPMNGIKQHLGESIIRRDICFNIMSGVSLCWQFSWLNLIFNNVILSLSIDQPMNLTTVWCKSDASVKSTGEQNNAAYLSKECDFNVLWFSEMILVSDISRFVVIYSSFDGLYLLILFLLDHTCSIIEPDIATALKAVRQTVMSNDDGSIFWQSVEKFPDLDVFYHNTHISAKLGLVFRRWRHWPDWHG